MHRSDLSAEAEELLAYIYNRGGQSAVVHDDDAVQQAVRAGLVELVTIGVPEPIVVLTPAWLERCRPRQNAVAERPIRV